VSSTGGFPFRSENYLASFDDDLLLRAVVKLGDETGQLTKYRSRFPGYTDLRLFAGPAGWQATAATNEHNQGDLNQQVLLQIDGARITSPVLLSSPEAGHQKNWMPVLGGVLPALVTDCAPTRVVRIDLDRQFTQTIAEHPAPAIANNFRGGSQLVPVDDGYVSVIHERLHGQVPRRLYVHRVVHFTNGFEIDAVSRQFVFQLRDVEFCAGLALDDGRFILSFGENDREAYLAVVPVQEFIAMLLPIGATDMSAR